MSKKQSRLIEKPIWLPVMMVVGIGLVYLMTSNAQRAERQDISMPPRPVEVKTVKRELFKVQVTAYGSVEPSITLHSKAEVSGRISYVHPDLKQGQSISAGTVVVKIDATDYTVSLKQTQADLKANEQALVQLVEEEKTTKRSLALSEENLAVQQQEYARINDLWDKKLVSRSTLDSAKQQVIASQKQVEDLQGKLNSFASRKDSVKANIARAEQQVKGQQTNLGRTEITLPFDAIIGNVSIEQNEFIATGGSLFEALDVTGVEIKAQLSVSHMGRLVSHLSHTPADAFSRMDTDKVLEALNLHAEVILVGDMAEARWPAKILRFGEAIDTTRRTMSLVVGVDNPYGEIIPGRKPPLLKGMYTAVNLSGPETSSITVPRSAVHESRVYLVGNDGKLKIRPVEVQFFQNDIAVIRSGLNEGEQVIVTDIYPVIEDMPVQAKVGADIDSTLSAVQKES